MFTLSFILAGKASYELIEANYISQSTVPFIPTIDFLGIYPFVETLLPQIALLALTLFLLYRSSQDQSNNTVKQN